MMRKATDADIGPLAAFLGAHLETSMFLLGNLEAHGLGDTAHPHGTTYFLREDAAGITGVLGATNGGFLMCQLPGLTPKEAQAIAWLLQGYTLQGITGAATQAAAIVAALPVAAADWRMNAVQPLYLCALSDLSAGGPVRPAAEADLPLLADWFAAYMAETGTAPAAGLADQAQRRARAAVDAPGLRLMDEDGRPVAMAAINARAGGAVQIGGVFVPPGLRGQGRGGRAVAGLLAEARGQGAGLAVLFAASPGAAKAYERIGFARCGDYRVALLAAPVALGNPA